MEFINAIAGFVFHIDRYPDAIIQNFGLWSYLLLFIIIFAETGLVVAPFLPGDSLLFVAGTFAPFVAGVGRMNYFHFLIYNVTGGILWVAIFVAGGFYFGNTPLIKENFSLAIFVIIFLSILPGVFEFWKHHKLSLKA